MSKVPEPPKERTIVLLAEWFKTQQYPVNGFEAAKAIDRKGGSTYSDLKTLVEQGVLKHVKKIGYTYTGKEYIHERRSYVRHPKTQSLSHSTPADFLDSCLSNCDSIEARKKQIYVAMKRIAKNCDSYVFDLRVPGDSLWGRMQ